MTSIRRSWLALLLLLLPTFAAAQSYTISPPPFLLAQNNSGAIINNSCVWTYVAGTTTAATTYSDNIGTPNTNPIRSDSAGRFTAFLSPGSSYKFVYESACTPPAHGTTLRTADNIAAMPTSSSGTDITGTAGESITAGQAVYLSAGDGSKTTGQWYKADSANAYSTSTNWVGIATVNIAAAGSGTIRIAGSVSGLTVAAGSKYYIGTAGAITATAPANARLLGEADSATSLVLTSNPTTYGSAPFVDDFRLSLTTATCVTTTDVTAATTLYLTPCTGNRITLFDSNSVATTYTSAEVSIAVPATTSQMYDIFAFASNGTPALELLAWTSDTARATPLVRVNGRWTKTGDPTRLYVGSFRTTTSSGQTEDSAANRLLFNAVNAVRRTLLVTDSTATWSYSTATWRQARGTTSNKVTIVQGLAERPIVLYLKSQSTNDTGTMNINAGIGEDSTSAPLSTQTVANMFIGGVNIAVSTVAILEKVPAVGFHQYVWLEAAQAVGTSTFYGGSGSTAGTVFANGTGLSGWIEN